MVPDIRQDAEQDARNAEVAQLSTDGSEETVWDMDDRGYDLGEGD